MISDAEDGSRSLRDMTIGQFPLWARRSADALLATLLSTDDPFPCTFAVAAARKASLRLAFIESEDDDNAWAPLTDVLEEYLSLYQTLGRDTSLVVLFRPCGRPPETLPDYFARFWSVLQYLHGRDGMPWPDDLPTDPEDTWWEFAWRGTPIFVVCNTPAYTRRRSRYHPSFMITFQPRWVFEGLAADTPRGSAARRVIRRRIQAFDGLAPAAELGNYGEEGRLEWRQYLLPDGPQDGSLPRQCPFRASVQVPPPTL